MNKVSIRSELVLIRKLTYENIDKLDEIYKKSNLSKKILNEIINSLGKEYLDDIIEINGELQIQSFNCMMKFNRALSNYFANIRIKWEYDCVYYFAGVINERVTKIKLEEIFYDKTQQEIIQFLCNFAKSKEIEDDLFIYSCGHIQIISSRLIKTFYECNIEFINDKFDEILVLQKLENKSSK